MSTENWGASPVPFIPGLQLSRLYYQQVVAPLVQQHFPDLAYSAGLIGYGSDVQGYDTPLSRDHMWGPRVVLLLGEDGYAANRAALDDLLRRHLPVEFMGYPTGFGPPDREGVRLLRVCPPGEVDHLIQISTVEKFVAEELGCQVHQPISVADWLTFSEQKLLAVSGGELYHDDLGFAEVRSRLAYFPRDVWLYLLASQWTRIAQEEPFIGRTAEVGDELGSRVIAARMVETLMRLAFLQRRQYAPYSKWFGLAFQRLPDIEPLAVELQAALAADRWQEREAHLCAAYLLLAQAHNTLALTEPVEVRIQNFHNRPYRVIYASRFAEALQATISDPFLKQLTLYGSPNQMTTSPDLLENPQACKKLKPLYE